MAKNFKACSVSVCNGNGHYSAGGAGGLCAAHYKRLRRNGDIDQDKPLGGRDASGREAFLSEIASWSDRQECVAWPFTKGAKGYGVLKVRGKAIGAHRYVCQLVHGLPPSSKHEAAHSCGNGHLGCVNPNHLSWKTPKENAADKVRHGTDNGGTRNGRAKLSIHQVRLIRNLCEKTNRQIAIEFGVGEATISNVLTRKTWANID